MGSSGLEAVLDAKVASGAIGDVQPFGHGAQVRKVVRAQATHKKGMHERDRVGVQVPSWHG